MFRSPTLRLCFVALIGMSGCAANLPEAPDQVVEVFYAPSPSELRLEEERAAIELSPFTPTPKTILSPRATTFATATQLGEPFYSNEQLHRNFFSIAMRAEAADDVDLSGKISVAKWIKPLRYHLEGATTSDAKRVEVLIKQLHNLTGIDIAPATVHEPNLRIRFVPFRARNGEVVRLISQGTLGPSVGGMVYRWRDAEREKCLGLISVDPGTGAITQADILIKDELPPRIRKACIVEEIVQSLGLMNDDPQARPSIFNDSQEYLDLTSHDEFLLRILYDSRVRPGMTARQMNPLVRQIIREVRPLGGQVRGRA